MGGSDLFFNQHRFRADGIPLPHLTQSPINDGRPRRPKVRTTGFKTALVKQNLVMMKFIEPYNPNWKTEFEDFGPIKN